MSDQHPSAKAGGPRRWRRRHDRRPGADGILFHNASRYPRKPSARGSTGSRESFARLAGSRILPGRLGLLDLNLTVTGLEVPYGQLRLPPSVRPAVVAVHVQRAGQVHRLRRSGALRADAEDMGAPLGDPVPGRGLCPGPRPAREADRRRRPPRGCRLGLANSAANSDGSGFLSTTMGQVLWEPGQRDERPRLPGRQKGGFAQGGRRPCPQLAQPTRHEVDDRPGRLVAAPGERERKTAATGPAGDAMCAHATAPRNRVLGWRQGIA